MSVEYDGVWHHNEAHPSRVSFERRAEWKLKWNFSFHKCYDTGTKLWPFTRAYLGTARWSGPETPVIEERWISEQAYTFMKLKDVK